jgi:hypothetical protein
MSGGLLTSVQSQVAPDAANKWAKARHFRRSQQQGDSLI